jgi:hypothetical protein
MTSLKMQSHSQNTNMKIKQTFPTNNIIHEINKRETGERQNRDRREPGERQERNRREIGE